MGISVNPIVRPVIFEDAAAVKNLHCRAGYSGELRDSWPGLWTNNPLWAKTDPKPIIGWVLEAAGEIVGYLGNIPLLCRYGEKTLVAAAASGFAVDPAYRGYGLLLAAAFYKQKDVDILLNTSANEIVAKVCQRFKAAPLPQQNYDQILFWILKPQPFMAAALRKLRFNSTLAWVASNLSAILLRVDIILRSKRPRRKNSGSQAPWVVSPISTSEIGQEFDDLWDRKASEETRLFTYRTAEFLRWHYYGQMAKVICCHKGADLVGYAVVIRDETQSFGLARSRIVDILVEKNDPNVVGRLLEAAYQHARDQGSHVLEVMGFPQDIRSMILRNGPYSRMAPNLPYYYRASDSELQSELGNEDVWYACPFDGDASL